MVRQANYYYHTNTGCLLIFFSLILDVPSQLEYNLFRQANTHPNHGSILKSMPLSTQEIFLGRANKSFIKVCIEIKVLLGARLRHSVYHEMAALRSASCTGIFLGSPPAFSIFIWNVFSWCLNSPDLLDSTVQVIFHQELHIYK